MKRLYCCRHTAKEIRWHYNDRLNKEGLLHHTVDGKMWKDFDTNFLEFVNESRNVQLGLAVDDFNLFGNMSLFYSVWPVVLTAYNLPPWLCIKNSYFMLTLLILGPQAPSKDMNVFF